MTDPNQIASSLSEAQRRFLMAKGAGARAGHSLWKKGLLRPYDNKSYMVTELGLAVRAIIERDSK